MSNTHGSRLGVVHVAADGVEVLVVATVVLLVVDPRHLTKGEEGSDYPVAKTVLTFFHHRKVFDP